MHAFMFLRALTLVDTHTHTHTHTKASLYLTADYLNSFDRRHVYLRVTMDMAVKRKRHVSSEKSDPCL